MPYTDEIMTGVALSGAVNKLEWLHANQKRAFTDDIFECAAASGSVAMVSHLHKKHNFRLNRKTVANQLPILQYFHSEGYKFHTELINTPDDTGVIETAAMVGAIGVLDWFDSIGCDWQQTRLYAFTAIHGRVRSLKWMYEHGAEFTSYEMTRAAQNGRLDVCQYLHSIGCDWNESACEYAAFSNDLELLKWLHKNGCPWDARQILLDSRAGHDKLRKYLLRKTPEWQTPAVLTDLLNESGVVSDITVSKWLRKQGAEWPTVLVFNNQKWPPPTVRWARKQGCTSPCS
jgi:hypothetical protein